MPLFYNRYADFIEVTIKDTTGRKIERFKCQLGDKRACSRLMKMLRDKYDFEPMETGWVNKDNSFTTT
jgi:hypothetical protein